MPDPVRISRYNRTPELGPKILFFSGGTALNTLSTHLKNFTHNSIHLATPFDSGGSSAKLRRAFKMPAIGDLRSRMVALADESITGHPEVYRLFTYRLPDNLEQDQLRRILSDMVAGQSPLIKAIPNPMRHLIRNLLGYFQDQMPPDFDLRKASLGNLVLTGGYLNNHRHLDPILFLYSKLVEVHGVVRTTVNSNLHLAAQLANNEIVVGQHRITGKETAPIKSPIKGLMLSSTLDSFTPATAMIQKKTRKLIQQADLICYPPGSFYSSLIAHFLVDGVSDAITSNLNPKVYIPNLGEDPEQTGMTLADSINTLIDYLRGNKPETEVSQLLNFILVDDNQDYYSGNLPRNLKKQGVEVIRTQLVSDESKPYYDSKLLSNALLSLTYSDVR